MSVKTSADTGEEEGGQVDESGGEGAGKEATGEPTGELREDAKPPQMSATGAIETQAEESVDESLQRIIDEARDAAAGGADVTEAQGPEVGDADRGIQRANADESTTAEPAMSAASASDDASIPEPEIVPDVEIGEVVELASSSDENVEQVTAQSPWSAENAAGIRSDGGLTDGLHEDSLIDAVTAALDADARPKEPDEDAAQVGSTGAPNQDAPATTFASWATHGALPANRAGDEPDFEDPDDGPTMLGDESEPMILADLPADVHDGKHIGFAAAAAARGDDPLGQGTNDSASLFGGASDTVVAPLPPEFVEASSESASAATRASSNARLSRTLPPPSVKLSSSQLRLPTPFPIPIGGTGSSESGAVAAPRTPTPYPTGRTVMGLGAATSLGRSAAEASDEARTTNGRDTAKGRRTSSSGVPTLDGAPRTVARQRTKRPSHSPSIARAMTAAIATRVQIGTVALSAMIAATFGGGLLVGRVVWKSATEPVGVTTASTVGTNAGATTALSSQTPPAQAGFAQPQAPAPAVAPAPATTASTAPTIVPTGPATTTTAAAKPVTAPGSITIVPTKPAQTVAGETAASDDARKVATTSARRPRPKRSVGLDGESFLTSGSRGAAKESGDGVLASSKVSSTSSSAALGKAKAKPKYTWVDPFAD